MAEAVAPATWQEEQANMLGQRGGHCKRIHSEQCGAPLEVLLDNQANISVMHLMLLEDVRQSDRKFKVNGVGGIQLIVEQTSCLPEFFDVYASTHTKANVLSFVEVEDKYNTAYLCTAYGRERPDLPYERQLVCSQLVPARWSGNYVNRK